MREGWFNVDTGELTEGVSIRAGETIIDVGCGDGGMIGFCASRGAEVIFIDQNRAALARTEARVAKFGGRYRAIHSQCEPIPIESALGDLVICTEVLEHVPAPAAFLDELIRIAKPGSQLLITVPDSRSEKLVSTTAPPQYFQEPNHVRVFSADDFRQLILESGLAIESHQFHGCFWSIFWPLSWMTCEPGTGLPVNNEHPIIQHWLNLWAHVQNHPEGYKIRDALNKVIPKLQCIVARKPM